MVALQVLTVPVLGDTSAQLQDAYNYAKVDDYGLALASALPKTIGAPIKSVAAYAKDGWA